MPNIRLINIFSATKIAKKLAVFIKILNIEDVSKLKSQEKIIEVRWFKFGMTRAILTSLL